MLVAAEQCRLAPLTTSLVGARNEVLLSDHANPLRASVPMQLRSALRENEGRARNREVTTIFQEVRGARLSLNGTDIPAAAQNTNLKQVRVPA